MGVYLYCVGSPELPEPRDIEGVEAAAVRALEAAGFRVWVSDMSRPASASMERVQAHNGVIEASADRVTALPMRFGQWFESETALRSALAERRTDLSRSLERVRGALEFGVRVVDPSRAQSAAPDRSSGRAYLEGLARREREAEGARARGRRLAAELAAFLDPLVREQRVREGGVESFVAIAHLVERHDTGTYRRRLEEFATGNERLRFVFTGPWPPYGFVDDGP